MPVKLITSDAKGLFNKFISEFDGSEAIRDMFLSFNKKSQQYATRIRKQISEVKGLSPWVSDISPTLIKTPTTSPSGDWNGSKLANIKIRGKLFLFKNALFEVNGFHSEEEAKLAVLKKYQAERSEIDFLKSRSMNLNQNLKQEENLFQSESGTKSGDVIVANVWNAVLFTIWNLTM